MLTNLLNIILEFLKFNPGVHEPIRFVHPEQTKTKYLSRFKPLIVDNLGTCDKSDELRVTIAFNFSLRE